ncbi:Leucine-rich repeat and IQ domain-containing protein 3 [Merluccius polli]|uniref:Leucine-rich repeat and IQ domain-containing protein 3 n=1 Tax=Merluccius polli TaxID=89951 RepID=A0AA47ND15_MERPO|nr:Leucine-rich repeat and IQ domain-containing protein 3 [Merluccius polli]
MDVVQKALLSCSESLVLGHGHGFSSGLTAAGPQDIFMASLGHLLLKDVKDLGLFKSLRICSLADNFITTIDALVECVHLVKLDLKGNQIVQLPDALFWGRLGQLQLLNLHGNHMETMQNIQGLAGCPKLTGLTLYDSPFSLKGDYRCTVVHSIWSLRALDHHVISDEELAGLHFPPKFKAFSPNLLVKLYGPSTTLDPYQSEIKSIQKILSEIHRIQATYSPILIIQRWIRGHLTRNRLGLVKDAPQPEQKKSPMTTMDSAAEHTTQNSWVKECLVEEEMQRLETQHNVNIKRITLNLNKLLQADSVEVSEIEVPVEAKSRSDPPPNTPEKERSEPSGSTETVRGRQHEKDPVAWKFPVHCFKASLLNVDPLRDMLITRRQESQDIRNATQNFHSRVKEIQPRLSIQHVCLFNGVQTDASEERWMNSRQGAPHGGGVDHEKLLETRGQAMKQNSEQVKRSLERRQGAKAARHSFMESRREKVVWQRERDRARMEAAMTQRRVSLDREMEDTRRRHVAFLEEKKRAASEREMAMEFSWRHASVTKAANKYSTQLVHPPLREEPKCGQIQGPTSHHYRHRRNLSRKTGCEVTAGREDAVEAGGQPNDVRGNIGEDTRGGLVVIRQQVEGLICCYVDIRLHLKTQHLVLLQSVQTDLEHPNIHKLSITM